MSKTIDERTIALTAVRIADSSQRTKYLQQTCAGDADLQKRVETLIASQTAMPGTSGRGHAETKLHVPSQAVDSTVASGHLAAGQSVSDSEVSEFDKSAAVGETVLPGTYIGPFELVQLIGRGGMGAVYLARQQNPRREVALKVIRGGAVSSQLLRRFELEAEVLGRLQHTGIAQIYQAGVHHDEHGQAMPYFAMELVRGEPLDRYNQKRTLSLRARLELVVRICDAIEHAHQKGIIHRDLKPSNILVGSDGQPKILDFGVARATNADIQTATLQTDIGQLVGTVPYMSPEQVLGDPDQIDTRSDVYALGVVAFELLAGRLPYELNRKMIHEAARIIREDEPMRLSFIDRAFRGDVETIVSKALEKDKSRRYPSAHALAADIRRYLSDEPISARPPGTWYQVVKFSRRNKALVGGVAAVFAVLVLGIIGTLIGLRQAVVARDDESRARKAAELATAAEVKARTTAELATKAEAQQHQRAEQNLTKARQAVEKYLAKITDDPKLKEADFTALRRELLASALPFYQEFAQQSGNDPAVLFERQLALEKLGMIHNEIGDVDAAIAAYREQVALSRQLIKANPREGRYWDSLATGTGNLASALEHAGNSVEAEKMYGEAARVFAELAKQMPDDPRYPFQLASVHCNLGNLLQVAGRHPEAEKSYRDGIALFQELIAKHQDDVKYRFTLANTYNGLGALFIDHGKYDEARLVLREAITALEALTTDFPKEVEYWQTLASSLHNLANSHEKQGQWTDAEAAYKQALVVREKLAKDFPSMRRLRLELSSGQNSLGILLKQMGQAEKAEAAYLQALETAKKLTAEIPSVPEFRLQLGKVHNNLGNLLRDMGRIDDSLQELRSALVQLEPLATGERPIGQAQGRPSPESRYLLAGLCANLGNVERDLGKFADAEATFRRGVEISRLLAADSPNLPDYRMLAVGSHLNLANLLNKTGKTADAEATYRDGIQTADQLVTDFPKIPDARENRAKMQTELATLLDGQTGREAEAGKLYGESFATLQQLTAEFPRNVSYRHHLSVCCIGFGGLLERTKEYEQAEKVLQQGLAALEPIVAQLPQPQFRQNQAFLQHNLADVYFHSGRATDAEAAYRKALAAQRKLAEEFPKIVQYRRWLAALLNNFAVRLQESERGAEAEPLLREALALNEKMAQEFPSLPDLAVAAANSHVGLGNLTLRHLKKPQESLEWYEKATVMLQAARTSHPEDAQAREFLRNAHWGRAEALTLLNRQAEAILLWDLAIELDTGSEQFTLRMERALSQARTGDCAAAIAEAEAIAADDKAPDHAVYRLSRIYSAASATGKPDAVTAEGYALHAVELLAAEHAKGYFKDVRNIKRLKDDPYFEPLRTREDFQNLVKGLRMKDEG